MKNTDYPVIIKPFVITKARLNEKRRSQFISHCNKAMLCLEIRLYKFEDEFPEMLTVSSIIYMTVHFIEVVRKAETQAH